MARTQVFPLGHTEQLCSASTPRTCSRLNASQRPPQEQAPVLVGYSTCVGCATLLQTITGMPEDYCLACRPGGRQGHSEEEASKQEALRAPEGPGVQPHGQF